MRLMFSNQSFNQDISNWNMSNVKSTRSMFYKSIFNEDVSEWDVSNVIDMNLMFYQSKFSGDVSNWNINKNCEIQKFGIYNINNYEDFIQYTRDAIINKI